MWVGLVLFAVMDIGLKDGPDRESEALFVAAYRAYQQGELEKSNELFEKIIRRGAAKPIAAISAYNLGCNHARLGRLADSIRWLRRAVELGYDNVAHLGRDPDLSEVRATPEFQEFFAKVQAAPPRPRAPVSRRQIREFADKMAAAHKMGSSIYTYFSRFGWFAHGETTQAIVVELAARGVRLYNDSGNWFAADPEQ